MQVKKESQQNQSRWWIWYQDAVKGIRSHLPRLHLKTKSESQNVPLSSLNVQQTSTERPVLGACSSNYSEWNIDDKWSSQEWKIDEVLEARTVRPVNEQPLGLFTQHTDIFIVDDDDMDSNTVAESDMSLKSRSFLHRVNGRVRKIQDQSSIDATQDSNKHSLILVNVHVFDITSICIHGKELRGKFTLHWKFTGENLTRKQMFDISEKLIVGQPDEIYGVNTISLDLVSDDAWRTRVCTMSTARVHYHQHRTTTRGWRSAPDAILLGHRRAPQWVLARTPTVHCFPVNGEAVGGPQQPPKRRSAARTRQSETQVSRQTW